MINTETWMEIMDELGVKIGAVIHQDDFWKLVESKPGFFTEGYKDYTGLPKKLHHLRDRDDAKQRERIWKKLYAWLYARGIVLIADKATRYGDKLTMTFENKKDHRKEKLINRPDSMIKYSQQDIKIIRDADDFDDDDLSFVNDYEAAIIKPTSEAQKQFRLKHDKRKIQ